MYDPQFTWPADAFDAVRIAAPDGQIKLESHTGSQVELACDNETLSLLGGKPEAVQRWLQINLYLRPGGAHLTLRLPADKAWVTEISAARGEVQIDGMRGRAQVMVGRGEVRVMHCRGVFDLTTRDGNVSVEDFRQSDAPEKPPRPAESSAGTPPAEDFSTSIWPSKDWWYWDTEQWTEWGLQFGEKASAWALQFSQAFDPLAWGTPLTAGLSLRLVNGNARLDNIQAQGCAIWLGKGDVRLQEGRIERLRASTSHGNLVCLSVWPGEEWKLRTRHGNLHLTLPANVQARIDAATRHGEVRSATPLVRVARPGPESHHGSRMVGTLGSLEGKPAHISLASSNGDVAIELGPAKVIYAAAPQPQAQPSAASPRPAEPEDAAPAVETGQQSGQAAESPAPANDDALMAVLVALSEGSINADEAEQLISSLESQP